MSLEAQNSEPVSRVKQNNQTSYFEYSSESASPNRPFLKQVISQAGYWGTPENCPFNNHRQHFQAPQATIISTTTYGGPASKYRNMNEDSYFFGMSVNDSVIAGVIDGSGGSQCGYLGGKLANQALAIELHRGTNIKSAFQFADQDVLLNGKGGYAAGVVVNIDKSLKVQIGSKGDARAVTIRNGKFVKRGMTKIQSIVAHLIETGELPPHAIHTARKKNVIYSVIGNTDLPLYESKFQGQTGDTLVLGSDGLWDVVTDYEIMILSQGLKGVDLQAAIYELAYLRNNSLRPFFIQFSASQSYLMRSLFDKGEKCRGDNITVQVIDLK